MKKTPVVTDIIQFKYSFKCSQKLTQYQLDYLNKFLLDLPTKDEEELSDIPEDMYLIEFDSEVPLVFYK